MGVYRIVRSLILTRTVIHDMTLGRKTFTLTTGKCKGAHEQKAKMAGA